MPVVREELDLSADGGCMAKLSANELERLLDGVDWGTNARVLVGLDTGADAGVYLLNGQDGLILTTDFFPPICRDPYTYGQIAAANALSDVYAMGGEPLAALNITLYPAGNEGLPLLRRILEGGADTARRVGIPVIGGHTIANERPVYGLAVLGRISPTQVTRNSQLQQGMALILTKPLGVGIAMAADRVHVASSATVQAALESMRQLNSAGAAVMRKHGLACATDITGFGLLGHAYRMARASGVTIELKASSVPSIPGVPELIGLGCIPGGSFRNADYVAESCVYAQDVPMWQRTLLADPQTSGGLLIAVDLGRSEAVVEELRASGYWQASIVGRSKARGEWMLEVLP